MTTAESQAKKPRIGFIGLGQMGVPMVTNLLASGYPVRVYNRTAAKARPLVDQGAEQAERPEDAMEPGGILVTCVSNDQVLQSIFDAHPDLFQRLGADGVHVSMSTVHPATSRRMADRHRQQGGTYVAAPIMGRPDAVAARMQIFLVSGPPTAVARVKPVLASLSRLVSEFGDDPGAANVAKLASNFLIASAIEAMAEAFTLVRKNGLDPALVHQMLSETFFAAPVYKNYGRQILAREWRQPLFRLELGLKDMGLVSQLAFDSRTPMPLAALLRDRFLTADAHGRGLWDWTATAAETEADAGLGSRQEP